MRKNWGFYNGRIENIMKVICRFFCSMAKNWQILNLFECELYVTN